MAQSLLRNLVLLSFLISMVSCSVSTDESILVKDVEAFNNALSEAKPGTGIKLANGIWKEGGLFELSRTSPLVNKGTDGKNLGLVNLLPLDKNTSDEK